MKRPEPSPEPHSRAARRRDWLVPALLLLHAAVPALGGAYRVAHLAAGGAVTPANQRFFDAPLPMLMHGVACVLFAAAGAFQFTPRARRNRRAHRVRGAIFVPSALVVAVTGLWMEATYDLPAHDGDLLALFRALFGTAMVVTTLLGVRALVRRDFASHGAWMMRTYAISMGAGTQVLVILPWVVLVGPPGTVARALLMGASWVGNLLVAEWALRRMAHTREGVAKRTPSSSSAPGRRALGA